MSKADELYKIWLDREEELKRVRDPYFTAMAVPPGGAIPGGRVVTVEVMERIEEAERREREAKEAFEKEEYRGIRGT